MRKPRRVVETSARTPDRHSSEDELVRAHLHLANQAVNELARRLPSHVNRDDLSSAAMLDLAQAARSGAAHAGDRGRAGRDRVARLPAAGRGPDPAPRRPQRPPRPGHPPGRARPDRRLARRRAAYHAAIAACSDFRARLDAAPLAPARAGRRGRLGRPHASLNPRSGNGFAWPGRCWITFLRSPPSLPVLLPSRRYAPFAPGLARLWRV